VESPQQRDRELRELRGLVERIRRGDCVLVLGPRVAIRAGDPERVPLDELLARELLSAVESDPAASARSMTLRSAADLHYRTRKDREDLELTVQDFYLREAASTTGFHRDLAHLPFRLCISASPDSLMVRAFEEAGKTPQQGHYSFREAAIARLATPTPGSPLVYHLFGHHEDPQSLVLTEADLIEFLVSIVKGTPPVPDQVRHVLADSEASFLFFGFGFHHWYLRVLLQVLNVYGHRSKAIAFEDDQFFLHPEREQVVGFFSGDRLIEFRPLRWEAFARQLREASEAGSKKTAAAEAPPPPPDAPKAFLSYASEDRELVEALAAGLQARGIRVWQDKQDLRAGDNWNDVLIGVIGNVVDYVVVVQTPAMVGRVEGVFHREIEAALLRQSGMGESDGQKFRFLIPVKVGQVPILSSLGRAHVIDVGDAAGVQALVQSIEEDWQKRAPRKSRVPA
jgi:hypothetical protein